MTFETGDKVSLERWDKTVPPSKRLGAGIIESSRPCRCESGYLVTVKTDKGTVELDSNWLKKA